MRKILMVIYTWSAVLVGGLALAFVVVCFAFFGFMWLVEKALQMSGH
jgi:hypothetical protein